jgi:hypothetical protein
LDVETEKTMVEVQELMVKGGAYRPSGAIERVGNKTGQGEADSDRGGTSSGMD